MFSFRKIVSIVTLLISIGGFVFAEEIQYLTEEYPPYNFLDKKTDQPSGFAVDLLKESLKLIGNNNPTINVYPWARGYRLAQIPGQYNTIFSTTRTKEREDLFKWVGPIITTKVVLFCYNTNNVRINKREDVANYNYSAILDDIGQLLLLNKYNVDPKDIYDVSNFYQMVKMVQTDRVQCFAYADDVTRWLMKVNNLDDKDLSEVFSLYEGELYYAFNKSIDDSVIKEHQAALDRVKQDHNFMSKLFAKYNIKK